MNIIGKIKLINETQTFGDNGFRKREMVVTTDEQYPQMIMIEFIQDKVNLLNNYQVGQDVNVSINIRGREWINPEGQAKYFNTIQGWRIEQPQDASQQPTQTTSSNTTLTPSPGTSKEDPDDLPF